MRIFLAALLLPSLAAGAVTTDKADRLFEKGLYQQALKAYAPVLKEPGREGLRALYRSAECEGLLFRYGDAAGRLYAAKLPQDPLWRARLLLLRAGAARQFLLQYGYALPAEEEKGASDPARLTAGEWSRRINADYAALWPLRRELLKHPLKAQGYFLDLKGADLSYTPTLWDFAALTWTDYLLGQPPGAVPLPDARLFLPPVYRGDYSGAAPAALKAAAIYEDASDGRGQGSFAAEYWKIKRLTLPFDHPEAVAPFERKALLPEAEATLKGWGDSFKTGLGRAWALYRAAALYQEDSDFAAALGLCAKAQREAPASRPASACSAMAAEIRLPRLDLAVTFAPPPGRGAIKVKARNLARVYFRAYRTSPEDLASMPSSGSRSVQSLLRSLSEEELKVFLNRKPDLQWSQDVDYPAPYQYKDQLIQSPDLRKGLYVVVASGDDSFAEGSSLIKAALTDVTDVFLLGTSGASGDPEAFLYDPAAPGRPVRSDAFRFYAVNALDGRPLAGAAIDAAFTRSGMSGWSSRRLLTGPDGSAAFSEDFTLRLYNNEYVSVDPLLSYRGAYAYWDAGASVSVSPPPPVSVFVETDRPVYRPGQQVRFKVTALLRRPGGYRTYDGNSAVSVTARDANWQTVYSTGLPFTGLGSAAGSFTIPEGRLLGRYSVTADVAQYGRSFSGSARFGVEEYKRPEFEVKLAPPDEPWRYGRKAEVSGEVKYYFGSPVPGAKVKYRVTRSRYLPVYCWYWGWFYGGGAPQEVASGETVSGGDGKFSFSFAPGPESGTYAGYPSSYHVEVTALDAGGRAITDARDYRAGAKALLFDVRPRAGFFTPDGPALLDARLMDLNGGQRPGEADYSLYRLEQEPAYSVGNGPYGSAAPSLEEAFSGVPDGKLQAEGRLSLGRNAPAEIDLGRLPPGAYRLELNAPDPWGGTTTSSLVVVSASPDASRNSSLRLPPVALFERDSYRPGETARVLIGASALKGPKFAEVLADDFVLSRELVRTPGPSIMRLKVGPEESGGFGLRWLGASDFKVYTAAASVRVPRLDKRVSLSLDYDKTLLPGRTADWTLKAVDGLGRPVSGEALVKVYDRSLEYYGAGPGFWTESLYRRRTAGGEAYDSLFAPQVAELPVREGLLRRMIDAFSGSSPEEKLPSLRVASTRVYGGIRLSAFEKSLDFSEDGSAAGAALQAEGFAGNAAAPASLPKAPAMRPASAAPEGASAVAPQARSDFSETAYYAPQLEVTGGKASFSFRIPERLTSWNVASYLLTRDAKTGDFSAETVTRKDLMVRLDIPRFFREGDRSRLTALVTNATARELSGEAALSLTLDGRDELAKFGVADASRPFSVKPGATQALYWDVEVPRGTADYKALAVARAGALSDAQQNDLPVLPSRERLIASEVAALDGDSSKTFRLPELEKPDPSRETEAVHLELQPQLILTVLDSLPFLVRYPYECTEQVLNRYVPLAVTDAFYLKYPQLKAAVARVPRRGTLTPAWDRNDPVRLMTLMETPWEERSKGLGSSLPMADMLDPGTVEREGREALAKLRSYQNADGSFPWFPGGPPSFYMTLYALDGLAEAARYGVSVPEDVASRALDYALAQAPAYMKPTARDTSYLLYAAYAVTSFPKDWPQSAEALRYARSWADYAGRHAGAMTPFGKAYAAWVYMRLGDKAKAESYLDRAMDGSREDPVAGVYWAPEKLSWLWYNDTVEKHAFILRTLLALRPKDPRIPGLVKWLLFDRRAEEWKSTKASAAAIYSLLDVMKAGGALERAEDYTVRLGTSTERLRLKPFDWVEKPLRWSRYGSMITPADLSPSVSKKGPGLAFASFSAVYSTDRTPGESPEGMLNVSRRYFLRRDEGGKFALQPLSDGDAVSVGDEIEVHLTVSSRSRFEYVQLKDPKPAGFEPEELRSGWKWDGLARYEEPRDSLTNFFLESVPHGEYVLAYRMRPTVPGTFRAGAAVIQSMYAPEFAAHSAGFTFRVK